MGESLKQKCHLSNRSVMNNHQLEVRPSIGWVGLVHWRKESVLWKPSRGCLVDITDDRVIITKINGDNESVPPLPENGSVETPGDFETAVSATGFGVFNVLLLLAAIPAGWTTVFDTSTIAFVMPVAECDLDLTLFRKGLLAAITYAGMICTAFVWGFIADRKGRKYLLLVGLILDALCNIFGSASQTYYVYLSFKFLSGIILGGPFAILMTYVAEFHSERHRTRVLMWTGSLFAVGNIAVPALAGAILTLPWSFSLFNNTIVFNSWQIFLIICSLPPFVGFLTITSFPESPKFLMTKGKYEDALKIFRRMYSMNTGKAEDTYPIKVLLHENMPKPQAASEPASQSTRSTSAVPYLLPVFIVNVILFASMTGMHIVKSWLPQLIVILNNFDPEEWGESISAPTICEKLDAESIESFRTEAAKTLTNATDACIPMVVSSTVYKNATIIAASAVLGSFLAGFIVNKFGKKNILLISLLAAGVCNFAIDWSPSTKIFLIISSASVALTGISTNTMTTMIIEVVPTVHRVTAVSLTLMTGRLGAVTGNLLFPILLNVSCNAPFYYMGGVLSLAFVLAIFLSKHSGKLQ